MLKHYELSTFVPKGRPLEKGHFRKKNLLTFGGKVKVILKNKNLIIKTMGTPQSNGGINDHVFVKISNNKIIPATIIEKDTVSASL